MFIRLLKSRKQQTSVWLYPLIFAYALTATVAAVHTHGPFPENEQDHHHSHGLISLLFGHDSHHDEDAGHSDHHHNCTFCKFQDSSQPLAEQGHLKTFAQTFLNTTPSVVFILRSTPTKRLTRAPPILFG